MAKEPDFRKFIAAGKGAGRTLSLKSAGPRDPRNMHASRMIERVADLKEAALKKAFGREDLARAADAAAEFKGSQQVLSRLSGSGALDDVADFTRGGAGGTANPAVLKAAGVPKGASFEQVVERTGKAFEELRSGRLAALMKGAVAELKEAAKGGDKQAAAMLKSSALKSLKSIGLAGIAGAMQPVPGIEDVRKAREERELEAVKAKGA